MQLRQTDRDELWSMMSSRWWHIIQEAIDEDIKIIDNFLLSPDINDLLLDPVKIITLINDQKKQRAFLVRLKNKPNELLNSFIKVWQNTV